MKQLGYYLLIICIIALSFFLYSTRFYPLVNSDEALNVLMTYYYSLPEDLYCWGMDRGGTLIPLIGQMFIALQCSPILAVSLSNYLVMIIGFFSLASLLKSPLLKILLAVIWFLPFQRFVDLSHYIINAEYTLLACIVVLLVQINRTQSPKRKWLYNLLLVFLSVLSIWVSDLSMVNLVALFIALFIYTFIQQRKMLFKPELGWIAVGIMAGLLATKFIRIVVARSIHDYLSFNDLQGIHTGWMMIVNLMDSVLKFRLGEPMVSVYYWLVILFIPVLGVVLYKNRIKLYENKWLIFFFTDAILVLFVIFLSAWVVQNDMARRYFIPTYISVFMVVLLAMDMIPKRSWFLKAFLILIVVSGAISPVYSMLQFNPGSLKSTYYEIKGFRKLGKCGLIGDFWSSYIVSAADPAIIKAVVNDHGEAHKEALIDSVFAQQQLFLIRNNWFQTFPDSIEQYGYKLIKDGVPFFIGQYEICRYSKGKFYKILKSNELKTSDAIMIKDSKLNRELAYMPASCRSCVNKNLIFGPQMAAGIGKYTAIFHVRSNKSASDSLLAVFAVSHDWGRVNLGGRNVYSSMISGEEYSTVQVDFEVPYRLRYLEFSIVNTGNADLYFDFMELKQK